jgi:hypothetical protein
MVCYASDISDSTHCCRIAPWPLHSNHMPARHEVHDDGGVCWLAGAACPWTYSRYFWSERDELALEPDEEGSYRKSVLALKKAVSVNG